MKPETQPNSKQFWKAHVNHWNKTSLSKASYCQEHTKEDSEIHYYKLREKSGPDTIFVSKLTEVA